MSSWFLTFWKLNINLKLIMLLFCSQLGLMIIESQTHLALAYGNEQNESSSEMELSSVAIEIKISPGSFGLHPFDDQRDSHQFFDLKSNFEKMIRFDFITFSIGASTSLYMPQTEFGNWYGSRTFLSFGLYSRVQYQRTDDQIIIPFVGLEGLALHVPYLGSDLGFYGAPAIGFHLLLDGIDPSTRKRTAYNSFLHHVYLTIELKNTFTLAPDTLTRLSFFSGYAGLRLEI